MTPALPIPDSIIFEAQEAAYDEMSKWSRYEQPNGTWLLVRNRASSSEVAASAAEGNEPVLENIEQILLTNKDYVTSFIQWRGVKAALEHYESKRASLLQ